MQSELSDIYVTEFDSKKAPQGPFFVPITGCMGEVVICEQDGPVRLANDGRYSTQNMRHAWPIFEHA